MKNPLTVKRKKRGFATRFIVVLIVIIASLGAVLFAIYNKDNKNNEASSKGIRFDVYSDNKFVWVNSGLAVASGAGTQLLNAKGDMQSSSTAMMQKPAITGSGDNAVAWSIGSKNFYSVGKSGADTVETNGAVINVSMNSEGLIAVAAEESGYKGAVSVFNKKLKPVYKWYSGEGYLIDAALSDTGDKMAALTMTGSGSKVMTFSLKSTDQKGSYSNENKVFFDIEYISSSRICLLSEDSAVFLNDKAEAVSKYEFTNGFLKDYSLEGSGFAVLAIGKYKTGEAASIVTLSADGKVMGNINISGDVLSLSARGKYVAVLYNDRLVIYNSNMSEHKTVKDVANIKQVLMRDDGSVVMISNSGALIYRP